MNREDIKIYLGPVLMHYLWKIFAAKWEGIILVYHVSEITEVICFPRVTLNGKTPGPFNLILFQFPLASQTNTVYTWELANLWSFTVWHHLQVMQYSEW